jgi:hypothetical protein
MPERHLLRPFAATAAGGGGDEACAPIGLDRITGQLKP